MQIIVEEAPRYASSDVKHICKRIKTTNFLCDMLNSLHSGIPLFCGLLRYMLLNLFFR
jgi:hypothetical protein